MALRARMDRLVPLWSEYKKLTGGSRLNQAAPVGGIDVLGADPVASFRVAA